jgi:uncharacterized Zn finger protein
MSCPKCSRKRYSENIIKRAKRNFMVHLCLGCGTQYDLKEVRKSKLTNEWVEKDDNE